MAYSRAELLRVVCAIAGRPVEGHPGTWPEASEVVEEAAALLAEVDHRWEVYMGARSATGRAAFGAPPCVRCGHVALNRQAWHEVAVLKFLHARFILERCYGAALQMTDFPERRGTAETVFGWGYQSAGWLKALYQTGC